MKINNPSDIIEPYVADLRAAFGEGLVCAFMYGSSVTHEYRPGVSDINVAVVLTDNAIARLAGARAMDAKWRRRRVPTPFYMTPHYIEMSLDTYPVEFLNMRMAYRMMCGEDPLVGLNIGKPDLRLQCERDLKGIALHLRSGYVRCGGRPRDLGLLTGAAMKSVMPLLRALLVLCDRKVPNMRSEIIGAVEVLFSLGPTVLGEIGTGDIGKRLRADGAGYFGQFVAAIDKITAAVDSHKHGGTQ